jgi:hypothetical protein
MQTVQFKRRSMSFTAIALSMGLLATWARWPSLDGDLRRDLELMMSGREAQETKVVGTVDRICFDGGGAERDFLAESRRFGDAFTRSLENCGVENSCCNYPSDVIGFIGLVKDGQIRCVAIDSFDFYLKSGSPFCVKPDRLAVSPKVVVLGEGPAGRPWVARSGRKSFEVSESAR